MNQDLLAPTLPVSDAGAPRAAVQGRWVPSRYNVTAVSADGSLIAKNTRTGALTRFRGKLRERVERMLRPEGVTGRCQGAIAMMVDRGFMVAEGTDEFAAFEAAFRVQHGGEGRLQLILLATEECNFRCRYCYETYPRGTMEPDIREGVKRYVSSQVSRLRRLNIDWFGGEPLLGWEAIEDLAPFLHDLAARHELEYASKLASNGSLLTPERVARLIAWGIRTYQITLDGPADCHDARRPARDGSGTFRAILDNLEAMHRTSGRFAVSLRCNMDRDNVDRIPELLEVLRTRLEGDRRFVVAFRPIEPSGQIRDNRESVLGRAETGRAQGHLANVASQLGLVVSDAANVCAGGLGDFVCYGARPYAFVIGAEGAVMKCTRELYATERNILGRLEASGEMILNGNQAATWTYPAFQTDIHCQKCWLLPQCQGMACPPRRWNPASEKCPMTKSEYSRLMRLIAERPEAFRSAPQE